MNREQLRQMIVEGDQRIMGSLLWRHLDPAQQSVVSAHMKFFQSDTVASDAALDGILALVQEKGTKL